MSKVSNTTSAMLSLLSIIEENPKSSSSVDYLEMIHSMFTIVGADASFNANRTTKLPTAKVVLSIFNRDGMSIILELVDGKFFIYSHGFIFTTVDEAKSYIESFSDLLNVNLVVG